MLIEQGHVRTLRSVYKVSMYSRRRLSRIFWNCRQKRFIGNDYVVKSPCVDVSIPETNLCSHLLERFPKYGKKVALIDGVTGREYSYNEIQESVVNMASGLVRSGMEKGDVLTLVSPNSAEFCTTFFSTLAAGGIMSTCNPQYTAEELAYQFKNSNSKYVATIPALLPTIKEAASKSGCVEKFIVLSDEGGLGEGKNMIAYQNLMKDSGSRFPHDLKVDPKEDTALIPYSSGTTGYPKGVVLSHYNMSSNVVQMADSQVFGKFYQSGNLLAAMPFFHATGLIVTMLTGFHEGCTKVILPKFVPEDFLSLVDRYKVTSVNVVPPVLLFLANHPMVDKYDISSLRNITYGAAPSSSDVAVKLKRRLNLDQLQHGYGLTEIGVTHVAPVWGTCKMESIGVPLSRINCKVVDVDTGVVVGPNCLGELVLQGPQMMKGYLNNPVATDDTIKNGWLYTGDFGYYDENDHFYITDRLKELIKVKGFQVAPAELEALLLQHPHISDVAVIGVDDERSGELPQAFVVRSSDDLTEQQVEDYVKGRVAEYKQLKGGVKFIKEIPKSPSGKILRRLLKSN